MEELIFLLEMWYYALEFMLQMEGMRFLEFVEEYWAQQSSAFNPGQQSIYGWYLQPALEEWLADVEEAWLGEEDPSSVDLSEYEETCFTCFDEDVMVRAFSDSITIPEDIMEAMIERGIDLQMQMEIVAWMLEEAEANASD